MSERPTATVSRSRSRAGYVDHKVKVKINVVPEPRPGTPSSHAPSSSPQGFSPSALAQSEADAASKNWVDRRRAARDPELDSDTQMRLARDPHAEVRIMLAKNSDHPNIEDELLRDKDIRVRQAMCRTDDVRRLRRLALDAAWQVRITVAHRTDDVPLLTELAEDRNPEVRTAARWSLAGGPFEGSPKCYVCYTEPAAIRDSEHRYRCATHA